MGKTKREKEEGRRRNEMREEKAKKERKEKAKKEKNNRSKKDNRRVIDLGWRERDSEVRRDEKTSTRKIPQVDPYL